MPSSKQKKILLLIAWVFATLLLYICFREIDLEQAWNNIKQVHPLWLFLGIAGHFLIFILGQAMDHLSPWKSFCDIQRNV